MRTNLCSYDYWYNTGGFKKGGTRTLGVECGDPPLTRYRRDCLPDTCIVMLHFDFQKHRHWVIWHEGRFYDPSIEGDFVLNETKHKYPVGVRLTSYLPIFMGLIEVV
jgi:hypothetical protein